MQTNNTKLTNQTTTLMPLEYLDNFYREKQEILILQGPNFNAPSAFTFHFEVTQLE